MVAQTPSCTRQFFPLSMVKESSRQLHTQMHGHTRISSLAVHRCLVCPAAGTQNLVSVVVCTQMSHLTCWIAQLNFIIRPCMCTPTDRIEIPLTWKIIRNTVYYEERTVYSDWCRCGALSEKCQTSISHMTIWFFYPLHFPRLVLPSLTFPLSLPLSLPR